jgi:ADP-heptose:LPS heptosyltransferase
MVVNLSARHVWPTDRWAQLLDYLLERFDRPVLVNAVGDDLKRAVHLAAGRTAQVRVLPDGATFREVACLVSRAGLLISPDTSLVHVAAAAAVPTVGLYPQRHDFRLCWIPPGEGVRVVQATARGTLASISVEQVCEAVDELFALRPARSGLRP